MMLTMVFRQICSMSFIAGICVLAVVLARLLLKKVPRVFSYSLWAVVLFRLLCPFSFESVVSLIPSTQAVAPTGQFGQPFEAATNIPAIDQPVNAYLGDHYYEGITVPAGFSVDLMTVLSVIWLAGCLVLLGMSLLSLFRLKKRLKNAVLEEGRVYHARGLETAFVLGVFRPKIYLPEGLSAKEREYILLHEQTHIRRGDHIVRILAFAALCLHWFNPLVWLAFFLSGRDMEMSCDEAVLKKLGNAVKKDYSASLLSLASGRKWVGGTPLAFGEGDTKSRIKNVLSYRKPAFWVLIAAVVGVAAAIFLLAANPLEKRDSMKWLNSLDAEDVRQIELVVMPSDENERYALYTEETDISAIVDFLREGKGRYVKEPESLAGAGQIFYVTMKDGSRHSVGNNGNTYLTIDEDSFKADYSWLSGWAEDYGRGNAPLPDGFSFDTAASPFGQEYIVTNIDYTAPEYSLALSLDGAPRYQLTQDGRLLESNGWILDGGSGDWTDCGALEEITLTRENFDHLFTFPSETMWENGLSASILREDTQAAWKTVRDNGDTSILYYILLQENGTVFLTYGYERGGRLDDTDNIRWVFRLAPAGLWSQLEAEELFNLRTDYVGDNSAVGKLLEKLGFPQQRDGFSLQTGEEPYGVTVNFTEDTGNLFPYEKNAALLLALIGNVDVITYQFPSDTVSYDRKWAEGWTGLSDVWVDSVEELASLLEILDGKQLGDIRDAEMEYLQSVLNAVEFTEDGMQLTLPYGMPTVHSLEIQSSYDTTDENGNPVHSDLFHEGQDTRLRSGYFYQAGIGGWKEGDQVAITLRFYEEGEGNSVTETAGLSAVWLYQGGEMSPQPAIQHDGSSTSDIQISETDYIQIVLNDVKFTENGMQLTLPEGMPMEHLLQIQANARIVGPDGETEKYSDLFAAQNETAWEPGETYTVAVAPQGYTDGSEVSLYLRFYAEVEDNTLAETARWYASWIYEDVEMVRQPWQPETTLRSYSQDENGEVLLNYSEPYGIQYALSLDLPEGWTAAAKEGRLTGGEVLLLDETDRRTMGVITPSPFTYYPEAAGENFPVSVYSYLMLGSGTNWNNEYTPVQQGPENADGVPVTETAVVKIRHTENGAAGPFTEFPGILSYNLDILRYISISFAEDVPQETVLEIANSIKLSK